MIRKQVMQSVSTCHLSAQDSAEDKAATNRWTKHLVPILQLQMCQTSPQALIFQLLMWFDSENLIQHKLILCRFVSLENKILSCCSMGIWVFTYNAMRKFNNIYFCNFFLFVCSLTTPPQDLSDDKGLSKSSWTPAVLALPTSRHDLVFICFLSFTTFHHIIIQSVSCSVKVPESHHGSVMTGAVQKWLLRVYELCAYWRRSIGPTDKTTIIRLYILLFSRLTVDHVLTYDIFSFILQESITFTFYIYSI